jgi:hypothetical protein
LPTNNAKSLPSAKSLNFYTKQLFIIIFAHGSDLAYIFVNGTKIKIATEIKQPLTIFEIDKKNLTCTAPFFEFECIFHIL